MTDEELAQAANAAEDNYAGVDWVTNWRHEVAVFLERTAGLDLAGRAAEPFQRDLWDANPLSGIGLGRIDVSAAIVDPEFRQWLAERSLEPLPDGFEGRRQHLEAIY